MKIIRWLAEVTGVAHKIRQEQTEFIGHHLHNYSYLFTGGLTNGKYDVCNAYAKYAELLIKGNSLLWGGMSSRLRDELYELSKKNECVHK